VPKVRTLPSGVFQKEQRSFFPICKDFVDGLGDEMETAFFRAGCV
jgi:hypothetical protein